MRYRHLIQEERYQISALREAGWSQAAIAARLERYPPSISRKLNRNRAVGPYRTQVAGLLATARSRRAPPMRAGGHLHLALRIHKQWRKRHGVRERRGTIPNQVLIGQRPAIVETEHATAIGRPIWSSARATRRRWSPSTNARVATR